MPLSPGAEFECPKMQLIQVGKFLPRVLLDIALTLLEAFRHEILYLTHNKSLTKVGGEICSNHHPFLLGCEEHFSMAGRPGDSSGGLADLYVG